MKIAILNQKGGSGKTTAAVLLAYAFGAAGKSVGLLDRDPQQTARRWLETAPGEGVEVARSAGAYDLLIIDTPGSLKEPGVAKAAQEADKIILVTSTSPLDVWATQAAMEFVKAKRPDLRPVLLFSRYEAHTEFGKTRSAYAKALGLRFLKNAIPERKSIQRATVHGYSALPPAEKQNLTNLALEIATLKP